VGLGKIASVFDKLNPDLNELHLDCQCCGLLVGSVLAVEFRATSGVMKLADVLFLKLSSFVVGDFFSETDIN
jgi:hypothetical protein